MTSSASGLGVALRSESLSFCVLAAGFSTAGLHVFAGICLAAGCLAGGCLRGDSSPGSFGVLDANFFGADFDAPPNIVTLPLTKSQAKRITQRLTRQRLSRGRWPSIATPGRRVLARAARSGPKGVAALAAEPLA